MSYAFRGVSRRSLLVALAATGIASTALRRMPSIAAERLALSGSDKELIAAMAEGIIPATDTPGAIGAGVPDFIAMMYGEWLLPEEQDKFRSGLASWQAEARTKHGKDFAACSAADRLAMLSGWDAAAEKVPPGGAKPPFAMFKALTIAGYYTSQVGQEQELGITMDAGLDDPNGPATSINMLQI